MQYLCEYGTYGIHHVEAHIWAVRKYTRAVRICGTSNTFQTAFFDFDPQRTCHRAYFDLPLRQCYFSEVQGACTVAVCQNRSAIFAGAYKWRQDCTSPKDMAWDITCN